MFDDDYVIEKLFPNIGKDYVITSPQDDDYNCIAFAADDLTRCWWPIYNYWPPNVPEREDLDSFIQCFSALGYLPCGLNANFEFGFDKVAIYVNNFGMPTHAARQYGYGNGMWKSKLGPYKDIEHTLEGLSGIFHTQSYGIVTIILKRKS